jgi:hypothetical protein
MAAMDKIIVLLDKGAGSQGFIGFYAHLDKFIGIGFCDGVKAVNVGIFIVGRITGKVRKINNGFITYAVHPTHSS